MMCNYAKKFIGVFFSKRIDIKMRKNARTKALTAAIVLSILASFACPVFADDIKVSERDALEKSVALYETLTDENIEVPDELITEGYDRIILKAATLGLISLNDYNDIINAENICAQDFYGIIYKLIISYNPAFKLDSERAERILNDCMHNAYIDDSNRISYAFMLKSGLLGELKDVNPNEYITKAQCDALSDNIYNAFMSPQSIDIDGVNIKIGAHISSVLEKMGVPNRIDKTDYAFDWYVYNSDYSRFVMVGVEGGRVCAFFSNSKKLSYNGVNGGEEYIINDSEASDGINIFTDASGMLDAVMYNPYTAEEKVDSRLSASREYELLDLINAYRAKNGISIFTANNKLNGEAFIALSNAKEDNFSSEIKRVSGYDVFGVYMKLVTNGEAFLNEGSPIDRAIGIAIAKSKGFGIDTVIVTNPMVEAGIHHSSKINISKNEESDEVLEITTPIIVSPTVEYNYIGVEDIEISLAIRAANKYHIEIFDYENDEYIVNQYITTTQKDFSFSSDLFVAGRDYKIIVSSVDDLGTVLSSEPVLISYGSRYHDGVQITAPKQDEVLGDLGTVIKWDSDIYKDFYIDIYSQTDELLVSRVVEDRNEVLIKGLKSGDYTLYVTALRRGSIIEKAQDCINFTVNEESGIITQTVIGADEFYNFKYIDEDNKTVNFYNEEYIEEADGEELILKRRITKKQFNLTSSSSVLAEYEANKEKNTLPFTINLLDEELGDAIVNEAKKYLGVPYVWGGTSPSGFDCSGLVQYVCNSLGIDIERVADAQFECGVAVSKDELMPGDLVFFENDGYIHHVGIYAGNNMMIHAPRTGDVVKYTSLDNDYYQSEYAGARRVY